MTAKSTLLEARSLHVSIDNKTICDNLNISFNAGESWGILGRNGSGKTTLLHTLAGLRAKTAGHVFLNQKDIESQTRKKIAQQLAILLQNNKDTFPSSVLETTLCGRHPHINLFQWESQRDIDIATTALTNVDMTAFLNRDIQSLSGGEQQRVAIATLLTQQTDIYLLDEPDTHLDLHYQMKLLGHFSQLVKQQQKLAIMSIHDINLAARFCDYFLMLYGNNRVIYGKKEDVLTKENLQLIYQHPFKLSNIDKQTFFIPE